MLAVSVTLLHGTIRAGSPDDTVLAGQEPVGEWPPSPARLFSALVSADGTGERCRVTTGEELAWLERLDPPLIYASGPEEVLRTALVSRFAVVDETAPGAVQDYPARKSLPVHPGVRQSPNDPGIVYLWPDAEPSPAQLAGLQERARRIGYLGCADSPVRVRATDALDTVPAEEPWRPDPGSSFALPVPYPGFLEALDVAWDAFCAGQATRRSWVRSVRAGYRPPGQTPPPRAVRPTVMWLRLERAIAPRMLLGLTETLRDAVFDHVQRLLPPGEEVPALLHGHRPEGQEGPQARFLALPDVGHPRADGRLLGAAVWLPAGTEPDLAQLVRTAVARLAAGRLVKPGWFDVGLSLHGGERQPWAAHPRRWSGPARRWVSATPVVHERWSKGRPDLAEIARWCAHADLPEPTRVAFGRHPLLPGGLDLRPEQVARAGRQRYPYSHLVLDFAEPVEGPVVLGRARQLGLGLMVPATDPGTPSRG